MPNGTENEDPKARRRYLEKRLVEGEAFLAKNPNNQKALDGYWRYSEEYCQLRVAEEDRLIVVMDLPPGVTWQPDAATPAQSRVTVALEGEAGPSEMSLLALGELNATLAMVAAAAEK